MDVAATPISCIDGEEGGGTTVHKRTFCIKPMWACKKSMIHAADAQDETILRASGFWMNAERRAA